ncbi:hypothetical protein [Nostoc sp. UHCC 0870]|uniref:hypothetical protein n=1 Tax=Nostoc sp. UHCC 0870 TaxID=2914041 RepID=UPI001EDFA70C|nr:hypothetical protein [Nostoc sp. UHCC 0870]UKP00517.1 hypothetical protein L6494_12775 [Nostoc sp. UHCC 0870]
MTISYNPIISKEELLRWDILNKIPVPDANTALVFVGNGQPTITITEGQKGLTRGEIVWGKYSLVYKVDLSDFPIGFECKLPCATDAFDFQAEVKFTCSVREPEMIIRRNVTNISSVLQHLIIDEMRRISRRYEVEESGAAEQEISNNLRAKIHHEGFNLKTLYVTLSLEEEARERIRRKKRLSEEHELEKIRLQQEAELQTKRNKQERQEVKAGLLDEMEIQMLKQNLAKQQKIFEEEQARRQELFQLEIMKQRTEFYSTMLQAGQWQMLALQLAQNPQDVPLILESLNQQKLLEREHQIKMLKILIDTDAVEGWQLSEVGKRALQELVGLTEQTTPALEEASLEDKSSNDSKRQTPENIPDAEEVFPD